MHERLFYRKFKLLIKEWVELGIMNSKLLMKTNELKNLELSLF